MNSANPTSTPASARELFWGFNRIALQGFGGVLAVSQRVLCEQKRWLTTTEFVELLAVAQALPGPNVCNLALMVGDRFFRWRGALAALAGMLLFPLLLVVAATWLYTRFADSPQVAAALAGMGAVSAGLVIGTALKLITSLRGNPLGKTASAVLVLATLVLIAGVRWPLAAVLILLGSLAWWRAWQGLKQS